jgi:hypothetical protein
MTSSVLSHRYLQKVKPMNFGSRQGANRSDTRTYREDLQRRLGLKDAVLFAGICGTGHQHSTDRL